MAAAEAAGEGKQRKGTLAVMRSFRCCVPLTETLACCSVSTPLRMNYSALIVAAGEKLGAARAKKLREHLRPAPEPNQQRRTDPGAAQQGAGVAWAVLTEVGRALAGRGGAAEAGREGMQLALACSRVLLAACAALAASAWVKARAARYLLVVLLLHLLSALLMQLRDSFLPQAEWGRMRAAAGEPPLTHRRALRETALSPEDLLLASGAPAYEGTSAAFCGPAEGVLRAHEKSAPVALSLSFDFSVNCGAGGAAALRTLGFFPHVPSAADAAVGAAGVFAVAAAVVSVVGVAGASLGALTARRRRSPPTPEATAGPKGGAADTADTASPSGVPGAAAAAVVVALSALQPALLLLAALGVILRRAARDHPADAAGGASAAGSAWAGLWAVLAAAPSLVGWVKVRTARQRTHA